MFSINKILTKYANQIWKTRLYDPHFKKSFKIKEKFIVYSFNLDNITRFYSESSLKALIKSIDFRNLTCKNINPRRVIKKFRNKHFIMGFTGGIESIFALYKFFPSDILLVNLYSKKEEIAKNILKVPELGVMLLAKALGIKYWVNTEFFIYTEYLYDEDNYPFPDYDFSPTFAYPFIARKLGLIPISVGYPYAKYNNVEIAGMLDLVVNSCYDNMACGHCPKCKVLKEWDIRMFALKKHQ